MPSTPASALDAHCALHPALVNTRFSLPLPLPQQADKLLSPEFQPVVEQLISFLPQNRQICLYRCAAPGSP